MKKKLKNCTICCLLALLPLSGLAIIPNKTYRFYPEKMGLIYRDMEVTTSDNIKIKTWFFPAQATLSEKKLNAAWEKPVKQSYLVIDAKKRPTVIICTGDAGNMSYQQLVFAQAFTNKGYNVVTFDWRSFGESSEWKMDTNYLVYTELLTDYDAVIKQVLQQKEVDISKIAVFGWSTGAYLSMAAASSYSNIKCFVAIGLITSFADAIPVIKKAKNKKDENLIVPKDYPKNLQPIYLAPTFNKATFLIVGENDDRSPVWMSEKVYEKLPAKKELWIVLGAEHGGPKGPTRDFTLLNKRIVDFLDTNLK